VLVYDVNSSKSFEALDGWRDEFLVQVSRIEVALTCLCHPRLSGRYSQFWRPNVWKFKKGQADHAFRHHRTTPRTSHSSC